MAPNCILSCRPSQITCTDEVFQSLWAQMPPATRNPYNTKTFIKRRQGTYGAFYEFANQVSHHMGPVEDAPELVQLCLHDAKTRAGSDADLCTVVHVNWYDSGEAWLDQHQDTEPEGEGRCIFSYSFLRGDDVSSAKPFRFFVISEDKRAKRKLACVPTYDGDLVIMKGADFQKKLFHGVQKTARKSMKNVRRLNVTVRMWGTHGRRAPRSRDL